MRKLTHIFVLSFLLYFIPSIQKSLGKLKHITDRERWREPMRATKQYRHLVHDHRFQSRIPSTALPARVRSRWSYHPLWCPCSAATGPWAPRWPCSRVWRTGRRRPPGIAWPSCQSKRKGWCSPPWTRRWSSGSHRRPGSSLGLPRPRRSAWGRRRCGGRWGVAPTWRRWQWLVLDVKVGQLGLMGVFEVGNSPHCNSSHPFWPSPRPTMKIDNKKK